MSWSNLNHKDKVGLILVSVLLGGAFVLSQRVLLTPILVPEFGILLFLLLQFGWLAGILFSTTYFFITVGFESFASFEMFESCTLMAMGIYLGGVVAFGRLLFERFGEKVTLTLALTLGIFGVYVVGNAIDLYPKMSVYHFVLELLITEGGFLVMLTNAPTTSWNYRHAIAALGMVFVMFLTLVNIAWFGLALLFLYIFQFIYGGSLTGLVLILTYSFFSTYPLHISAQYLEVLGVLMAFLMVANILRKWEAKGGSGGLYGDGGLPVESLREFEGYKQLAAIINYSSTVAFLWQASPSREVAYVSDNAWRIGYSPLVFREQGRGYNSAIFEDDRGRVMRKIQEVLERGRAYAFELEYRLMTESGQVIWVVERSHLVKDASGEVTHMQGTVMDITMNKEAEKRLHRLTYYDELTGLRNRVAFIHELQQQIDGAQAGEVFAVLMVDIDKFKHINDSFGHQCGDEIICGLAKRFNQLAEAEHLFLARHANDDFIILMRAYKHLQDVERIADRMLKLASEPFPIHDRYYPLTASIGISLFPLDGRDVNQLISNANVAVYQAKEYGKNNFLFYNKNMRTRSLQDLRLASDLNIALQQEQFVLFYQPKINLQTHRPTGAEVLLRWQHPERGLLSPNEFISLAEETGAIVDIGGWVFKKACYQLKAWEEEGLEDIHLGVNLSPRQFWDPHFLEFVTKWLDASRVRAEMLELELTESMVMREPEQYRLVMRKLKEMGIQISVDDFGVGHSSLNQIKRFPIDAIKIDKSFILDLPHDSDGGAITKAIVALGHSLNLRVVAEGVENAAQAAFLESVQCDEGQGYYYSKPLSAEEYIEWYRSFNHSSH